MRILVDTNVLIEFWKNPTDKLISIFEKEDLCVNTVIASEVLVGAYSEKNLHIMIESLMNFTFLPLHIEDRWIEYGDFLYKLRKSGITVPYQDAVIAFCANCNGVPILTNDKHFEMMQSCLTGLTLY